MTVAIFTAGEMIRVPAGLPSRLVAQAPTGSPPRVGVLPGVAYECSAEGKCDCPEGRCRSMYFAVMRYERVKVSAGGVLTTPYSQLRPKGGS